MVKKEVGNKAVGSWKGNDEPIFLPRNLTGLILMSDKGEMANFLVFNISREPQSLL